MRYLFDLDETLVSKDLIKVASTQLFLEEKIDKIYTGADTIDFEMSNLPQIVKDKTFELFSNPIEGCLNKKPITGSYLLLYYLIQTGNDIGIVTSRPEPLHDITKYVLFRDFPKIKFKLGIHFSNNKSTCEINGASKYEIIKDIRPDYYFDDYIDYCDQAVQALIPNVYLIQNKYTGWNRSFNQDKYPLIKVIKSVIHYKEEYGIQN